jgi:hypothetical protein
MSDDELGEDDATLMRIDPAGGASEAVMALAGVPLFTVFEPSVWRALHGPLALSPDGTLLAVYRIGYEWIDPLSGVWLFDMTGGDAPRQVVALAELRTVGMPSYSGGDDSPVYLWPMGLAWALDGAALIVSVVDSEYAGIQPRYMTYFVNAASEEITPLVDFSDVPEPSVFYDTDSLLSPGDVRLFDVPVAAAVTPDGKRVIMGHGMRGMTSAGLTIFHLPPRPDVPLRVFYTDEEPRLLILNRSMISMDGRYMLLGGSLYTLRTE